MQQFMNYEQILTDGVMFVFTGITLCIMLGIMLLGLYRRNAGWMWCAAFNVPYAMVVAGYYVLWASPDSPTLLFPIVSVLTRPGIVGFSLVVVSYSIFRLLRR